MEKPLRILQSTCTDPTSCKVDEFVKAQLLLRFGN